MNDLKLNKTNKSLFSTQSYKFLNKSLLIIYALFMLVYIFRNNLYELNNKYTTLFLWTAPNLIPSLLFTLICIFYVVPTLYKSTNVINNPKFILFINVLNMAIFALIEYLHVFFNLGTWDNKDMIASLIGIIVATITYFKVKKFFTD